MLKVEQCEEVSSIENTYEKKTKPTPQKKEKNKATARDWRNLTEKREQDLQKKKTETNLYGFYKIDNGTLILRPETTTLLFCTDL